MSINPAAPSATSLANLLKQYQVRAAAAASGATSATTASDPQSTSTTKVDRTSFSPEALQALQASFALQMLHGGNQEQNQTASGVPDLLTSLGLGSGQTATTDALGLGQSATTAEDPLTTLMGDYTKSIVAADDRAIQAALARAAKTT